MSKWLIAATGFAYLWVAIEQWIVGNRPLGAVYLGYAFSNIGLYLVAK